MGFDIPGLFKARKARTKTSRADTEPKVLDGRVLDGRFEIIRRIGGGGMGSTV